MKRIFPAAMFAAFISSAALGADINMTDWNCSAMSPAKGPVQNRIIGAFDGMFAKSGLMSVAVNGRIYRLHINDKTKWQFTKDIEDMAVLSNSMGACAQIEYDRKDERNVAKNIKILPQIKIPEKQRIRLAELKPVMGKDVTLVDSRPSYKFDQGSLPGAVNITLEKMKDGTGLDRLPKDKNSLIVFYCGGTFCTLSYQSLKIALDKGYKNAKVYADGFPDWSAEGNISAVHVPYLKRLVDNDLPVILLDIREDIKGGYIRGAAGIKYSEFDKIKLALPHSAEGKKSLPVIVYASDAKDENFAREAAAKLIGWGYERASYLVDGYDAFSKTGLAESGKPSSSIKYTPISTDEITPQKFADIIKRGIPKHSVLIDLREKADVADFPGITMLGGKNIPLSTLIYELPKDRERKYYLFSDSAQAAAEARAILRENGFENVKYINAGIAPDSGGGIKIGDVIIRAAQISKLKK